MYTVVYPSLWGRHAVLLSRILETRQGFVNNEVDSFDTPTTVYVAYEKESYGIFGSCRLNFLNNSPASSFYKGIGLDNYLEVSLTSLEIEKNHWLTKSSAAISRAKNTFFSGLYRVLIDVVKNQGCQGLVILNSDYRIVTFLRRWPFTESYSFKSSKCDQDFWVSTIPLQIQHENYPLRQRVAQRAV